MTFLISGLKVDLKKLVVIGRSIGSGPATYIATKFRICCLILISPILSIKKAASEIFGQMGSYFLRDRFDNENIIKNLVCPVLLLHGDMDTVIPPYHSELLMSNA